MTATIKDVAKLAGVSPATVSRALSSPELVRAETRERVEQAAAALSYFPNRAARGLITGRTGNIGLIVPDLTNPFFPGVVKGAQVRARTADYSVLLADSDEDPAVEADLVRLLSKQVDGIILCSSRMGEEDLRSLIGEIPMVMLNRRVSRLPSVTLDNVEAMGRAVDHLVALGHRRVAYVPGPQSSWSNRERLRALRIATAASDIELVEITNVVPQFAGGIAAGDLVLAANVTAVIAYNDLIALGLLSRFAARGVAVPARISVMGFDDTLLSDMISPALTTLAQPTGQIGRVGVDLLLALIADPSGTATRRELPAQLLVRASTGPVPHP